MRPLVRFPAHLVEQGIEFLNRGWTYAQAGEAVGRKAQAFARYVRVYEMYGPEAFTRD